jgi:transposase
MVGPIVTVVIVSEKAEEGPAMEATLIGVDVAKSLLHLVAMSSQGKVIWRKALPRGRVLEFLAQLRPATVAMEACATAHYWGRELQKLGHEVKLIHPAFVVPFRKSGKIRGLLAEYGITVRRSISALRREAAELAAEPEQLSATMRLVVCNNLEQLWLLDQQLAQLDRQIAQMCRTDERSRRLTKVTGVGVLTATAMVAKVGNARQFPNGRALAAYFGLVPRQKSTGGKTVLLGITKKGDRYLRTLLIHGARAALQVAPRHDDRRSRWALQLRAKSGPMWPR